MNEAQEVCVEKHQSSNTCVNACGLLVVSAVEALGGEQQLTPGAWPQ